MDKQTEYSDRLKKFKKSRIDFDDTVQDVADHFGYSGRRIYDVLKYPNENKALFQRVHDYVKSAGYPFNKKNKRK